ncbi:unnamed protein product [Lymnaea stagnalis]|uniref:Chitin-binding type-2 domain-containing protein n=1 Tax=Lymnaea stagnalis TaxID=6523 RepID=A0AAV2HN45_LYMST
MGFTKMWVPGQCLLLLMIFGLETSSAVPIGTLSNGDTDLTDLQALLTKNLPGTAEDKASIVELMLQLLAEIDLPTLCDVIANDTKSKRGKTAETTTVNMENVLPTVETVRVEAAPVAISYFNTIGQTKAEPLGSSPRISLPGRKKLEARNPAHIKRGLKHTSVARYHMSLLDKMNERDDSMYTDGRDIEFAGLEQGKRAISNPWSPQSDASPANANGTQEWLSSLSEYTVSNRDLSKHILNSGLESMSSHENLIKPDNARSKNLPFNVDSDTETGSLGNDVRQNQIQVKSIGIERPKNNLYSRSLLKADATSEESLTRTKRRREDRKAELKQRYNTDKLSAGRRRKTGYDMKLKRRFPKEEMLPSRTEYQSDLFEFVMDQNTSSGFLNGYKQGPSSSSSLSSQLSSATTPQQISFHTSMKPATEKSNVFGSTEGEKPNHQHLNLSKDKDSSSLGNERKALHKTTNASVGDSIPTTSSGAQRFLPTASHESLQEQKFVADDMGLKIKTSKLTQEDNFSRINETVSLIENSTTTEQPQSSRNSTKQEQREIARDNADKAQPITPFEHFSWNTELISNLDEFFGPYVNAASATDDQSDAKKTGMTSNVSEEVKLTNDIIRDNNAVQSNLINDLSENLQKASSLTDDNARNYFHIDEINHIIHGAEKEDEASKSLNSVERPATVADNIAEIENNLISYGVEKDSPQLTTSGYSVLSNAVESKYEYYVNPTLSGYGQDLPGSRDDTKTVMEAVTSASIEDSTTVQLQDGDLSSPNPADYTSDQSNVSSQSISLNATTRSTNINASYNTDSTADNIPEYVTPLDSMPEDKTFILNKRTHDVVSVQQESLNSEPIMNLSANLNRSDASSSPISTFNSTLLGNFSDLGVSKYSSNESVSESTPRSKNQEMEEKLYVRNESMSAKGNETLEDKDIPKRVTVVLQSDNVTSFSSVNIQTENITISSMEGIKVANDTTLSSVLFHSDNITTYGVGIDKMTISNETSSEQLQHDEITSGRSEPYQVNNLTTESAVRSHLDTPTGNQDNNVTEISSGHPLTDNITGILHEPQELHVSRVAATFDTHLLPLEIRNNNDDIVVHYQTPYNPEPVMPTSPLLYQVDVDQGQEMTPETYIVSGLDGSSGNADSEKDVRSWRKEQPSQLSQPERDFISIVRGNHRGISSSVYNSFLGQPVMKSLKRIHEEKTRSSTLSQLSTSSRHEQYNQTILYGRENTTTDRQNVSTNTILEHTFSPLFNETENYTEAVKTAAVSIEGQGLNYLDNAGRDANILAQINTASRIDYSNNESATVENLNLGLLNETHLTENNGTTGNLKLDALNDSVLDDKNVMKKQAHLQNDAYAQENLTHALSEAFHVNETLRRNVVIDTGLNDGNRNRSDSENHNVTVREINDEDGRFDLEKNETSVDITRVLYETLNTSLLNERHSIEINDSHSDDETVNPVQSNATEFKLANETLLDNKINPETSFREGLNESRFTDGARTNVNDLTTDDSLMANSRESQTLQEIPKVVVTEINTQPLVDTADTRNIMYQSASTEGDRSSDKNVISYFSEMGRASGGYQIPLGDSGYTTSDPVSEAIQIETTAVPFEEESSTSVTGSSEIFFIGTTDMNDDDRDENRVAVTPVARRKNWAKTIENELKRAEKFRGRSSFDADEALPLQLFDRSYSKLGTMNEEGPGRFFYHPSIRSRVKPESSPFSAGISNWMNDGDRNKAKKVTVNPWKAFNIELGKKKVERQREMTHGSRFQSYPGSNNKHRDDLMQPSGKDYLWNARPWPAHVKNLEQRVNNEFQKQKYRFGITKLNELLRGRQGSMHFEPMRKAHAKQWGDRFSQGYYGRVLEEQNHAPTIIHAFGLPPHIDLASYNTHDINAKTLNDYKTTGYLGGKRSSDQDDSADDFFAKDHSRKWRKPTNVNVKKSKFSTLTDDRRYFGNFAASEVIGRASEEWGIDKVETTTVNPTIDAPVVNLATRGDDTEMAPSSFPDTEMAPGSVPAEDFKCPGLFGYHSDPKDCNSFYMCSWGVSYKLQCSPGTLWNSRDAVCDWAANVNCDLNQGKTSGLRY